jgi:hypothetical protein
MKDLMKKQHGAGGFKFYLTSEKGNTRLGVLKKTAIINALNESWTEGVYETTKGEIIRQLLNGNTQTLTLVREEGNREYYFI